MAREPNKEYWANKELIEKFEEEIVFHLSEQESKKCRFRIINHSTGDAECYVHDGNHGIRLFPKHLWDIIDGKVYHLEDGKWKRWLPNIKENLDRFEEWEE